LELRQAEAVADLDLQRLQHRPDDMVAEVREDVDRYHAGKD
jgi:hypothetical protein